MIEPDEHLGRGVASRNDARRARRSRASARLFMPRPGRADLSVDRLIPGELDQALATAMRRDIERERTFYGWAILTPEQAEHGGRNRIEPSPTPENPYHADIVMPDDCAEQEQLAQLLADLSRWCPNPLAQ